MSRTARRGRALVDELWAVLPAWIVARVLLVAALVAAYAIADRLTPGARPNQLTEGLIAWDGTWYRDIARSGYGALPQEGLRFFPLYPLVARALSLGVDGLVNPLLIVLANVASLGVAVGVRRLVRNEGLGEAVASRAVWLVMLFPSAFVLAWAYAEAFMLAATIAAFVALRRERWWWAALAGLVAGLSRPLGLVLVLPAAIEVVRTWRGASAGDRVGRLAAVGAPIVGTGTYLLWVRGAYGDALLPYRAQGPLRGEVVNPLARLWEGLHQMVGPERLGDGLHIPFALGFVVLLVITFRKWPVSYGVYAASVLLVALGAENLNSLERYGLNAFPLVLTLALLCRDDRVERSVLTICAGGFVALASLAWLAAYVP